MIAISCFADLCKRTTYGGKFGGGFGLTIAAWVLVSTNKCVLRSVVLSVSVVAFDALAF